MTAPPAAPVEALIERLHGEHGSGLLARLGGAKKMMDAGRPLSTWVAACIDADAAQWITEAAAALGRLRDERDEQKRIVAAACSNERIHAAARSKAEAESAMLRSQCDAADDRATKAEAELAAAQRHINEVETEAALWRGQRSPPREPYLGLATTKQLIDELASRADVSAINGEAWPSYWTAMPDGGPT